MAEQDIEAEVIYWLRVARGEAYRLGLEHGSQAGAAKWRDPIRDQPPARRRVLIAEDDGSVDIAKRMKDGRWVRRREGLFKKPRAWAPLPDPPEEVRDG